VDWDRYSHDSLASSGYGSNYDQPPPQHGGYHPQPPMNQRDSSDGHAQLLSFKSWLSTQDDTISDQEALTKYAEYKQEFKRQQLNEFFVAHREEEWFKNKYHPDECTKRRDEQYRNLKKRVNIFMEFLDKKRFDDLTLDSPHADKLIKLMDWYVIRLEDGTDEDAIKLLCEEPVKPKPPPAPKVDEPKQVEKTADGKVSKAVKNGEKNDDISGESGSDSDGEKISDDEEGSPKASRKRRISEAKAAPASPTVEDEKDEDNNIADLAEKDGKAKDDSLMEDEADNISADEEEPRRKKLAGKRRKSSGGDSARSSGGEIDDEKVEKANDVESNDESGKTSKKVDETASIPALTEIELLPQLHRTASIFLRNLAPSISKAEVEGLCKKYPGFLRVAIADPQADRRWFRRGWVTFRRNVNIKEICWNMNNIRVKDTELGAIVNRDLSRRVRTVNGITPHKTIVRNDIRLAAKVIQHLDSKWNLWDDDSPADNKESYGVYSTNPVLKNITDYLIEEASAEEEELLGMAGGSDGELDSDHHENEKNNTIDRDEELIQVLDRLLLYLRFVHSLDYYNHAEYPYEDDMPNRLGIIHGRGMPPASKVNLVELQEYNRSFEQKISTFCVTTALLTDEECKVLGTKDEAAEVEKFISANTQELGKDKWLCPLSGKKFKGPEFVRKHITNKHGEKLEEVRKEVIFFNNFLRDSKRPHTPEANSRQGGDRGGQVPPLLPGRREPMMMDSFHPPAYPPFGGGGYGGGGNFAPRPPFPYRGDYGPRGGGRAPYNNRPGPPDHGRRQMISYRDLDAPAEPDDF
jgi:hypothetical protein